MHKRLGFAVLDTLQPFVLAFAIFMMFYLFVAQPHRVDGRSMYPNFHDKDFILTDKVSYKTSKPQRGDVVVFHAPDSESDYIKRVVGLPGESIMIKNGFVYINGVQLKELYLPSTFNTSEKSFLRNGVPYRIPEGRYMFFGDNRNYSRDSREFGPVKLDAVVGKAIFIYWPIDRLGFIKHERLAI